MASVSFQTSAHRHPKIAPLSAGAFRVWHAAIAYCKELLTDGYIAKDIAELRKTLGVHVTVAIVGEMLTPQPGREHALWHDDGGRYRLHDWADWQDSKEEIQRQREAGRARVREHRRRRHEGVPLDGVTPLHDDGNADDETRYKGGVTQFQSSRACAIDPRSEIRDPSTSKISASPSGDQASSNERTAPLARRAPVETVENRNGHGRKPATAYHRIAAIVRELLKTNDYRYDGGEADLCDDAKRAAAAQGIDYDGTLVRKAIESEQFKAARRAQA